MSWRILNLRILYFNHRLLLLAGVLLFLFPVSFFFDLEIANACRRKGLPGELKRIVNLSEVFAHGYGIAGIILTLLILLPSLKKKLFRVAACAAIPGIVVTVAKVVFARMRPNSIDEKLPESVWQTFEGFCPFLTSGDHHLLLDRSLQSFPSGHSTAAVGFAIGLSWLFPRGKWAFATFAILAIAQRINCGAHFLSDTIAGAFIAVVICTMILPRQSVTINECEMGKDDSQCGNL